MPTIFFIFFITALLIIASAHFFLYRSVLVFFNLTNRRQKIICALVLAVFAVGFIAASILVRSGAHPLLAPVYYIFAFWYGIIIYLILSAAALWIIKYFATHGGRIFNFRFLAGVFIILSFLTAVLGAINARYPRVKPLDVTIAGLPPAWQDKTLVHISDVHAGIINKNRFLEKMVAAINRIEPEAVFITGDYFDGTCSRYGDLARPLAGLKAPAGIFFVIGNHETYIDSAAALAALEVNGVSILRDEYAVDKGLKIIGLDYRPPAAKNPAGLLKKLAAGDEPAIFLYHEPRLAGEAEAAGIDLQLSGHIHRGQIFPFNLITRLIYGRYHYGFHRWNDYQIYTTSGAGTWGPPIRTAGAPEIIAITLIKK